MTRTLFSLSLLYALSLFNICSAAPALEAVATTPRKVITGRGLPSLESLGLTPADLFNMGTPDFGFASAVSHDLIKRIPAFCDYGFTAPASDCIAGLNYLASLGSQSCAFYADSAYAAGPAFVNVGSCTIRPVSAGPTGELAASCADVAAAGWWVVNNCHDGPNGNIGGANPPSGNGDFSVWVN